jgi:hypothetical protein
MIFVTQIMVCEAYRFSLYSLGLDTMENTSSALLAACIVLCIATFAARTTENTAPVLLAACSARCIATVAAQTTENTASILLAACVLLALSNNRSTRHNTFDDAFMTGFRLKVEIHTDRQTSNFPLSTSLLARVLADKKGLLLFTYITTVKI